MKVYGFTDIAGYKPTHEYFKSMAQAQDQAIKQYLYARNAIMNHDDCPHSQIDNVEHPKHYTSHPSGVEAITVCEHMNFNLGNAIKYVWRADLKNDTLEDLKKARWYLDREIQRIEKQYGITKDTTP